MLSLHTNAAALATQTTLGKTQSALSTSMTRLGSGYRINSAMDDAAGLQIATRLNSAQSGMAVAMRNSQNGISMMQTAEGALDEATNILIRQKDLATQAADGSSSAADVTAMQAEYDALTSELSNIFSNTAFGGQTLFTGAGALAATTKFQIGASAGETMTLTGLTAVTAATFTGASAVTLSTGANGAITSTQGLIDGLGAFRSQLGAFANRLDHSYNNVSNMRNATQQARGRIMDVDYASETANMTTNQMLMQAGTSMLKQSSSMSQLVMSLMQ
jgi:flagellin